MKELKCEPYVHYPKHEIHVCISVLEYRIARNFRGLKFSRMSPDQTFRDLIFEDYVARYLPRFTM